jgi:hypothetical protein
MLYTSLTFTAMHTRVKGFEHYLSQSLSSVREIWLEG